MSRSPFRIVLIILVVLVLIVGAAGGFVWWKISGLKEALVGDLEKALDANVQVTSIDLDVWQGELHAAGITLASLNPSAPWSKGDIAQATVRFHLSDILSSKMPLRVEVTSWSLSLRSPLLTAEAPPGDAGMESSAPSAPGRIQVTEISAQQGTVEMDLSDDRKVTVHGVAFEAGNNDGAGPWTTQLQAASIVAGSFQTGASSVQIRGEPDKINFSDLRLQVDPGAVTGEGEISLGGNHDAQVNLKALDVPIIMLVGVEWQMKLSGLATGDLDYEGNDHSGGATGKLAVSHGKFNVLPWLAKLTSLVGLQDISDVEVDKATSDFEWKNGTIHLSNIDVRKENVTRISGTVDIDAQDQVDGRIKLGLPSVVISKWPQLQDKVFPDQNEGYNWADVHLTGTPSSLQEDLTPRLLTVTIGQGTDLLNQATQKATDLFNTFLGTGTTPSNQTPPPAPTPPPPTPSPTPAPGPTPPPAPPSSETPQMPQLVPTPQLPTQSPTPPATPISPTPPLHTPG